MNITTYVVNCSSSWVNEGKTPKELIWLGKKLNLGHLKILVCANHVVIINPRVWMSTTELKSLSTCQFFCNFCDISLCGVTLMVC
jgi:hypothetical protein